MLFGFSRHLFRPSRHSTQERGQLRSFLVREALLDIRLRLFGEEHRKTADSFHKVGVTQHSLGDCISVLEPKNHALDIRRKLFGENHSETADSYLSVGVTQHSVGDYNSALESKTGALEIRRKTVW